MTMAYASPASAAFGVRLRFVLRFIKTLNPRDRAPPVTSLVRHPVTKLREATRGSLGKCAVLECASASAGH